MPGTELEWARFVRLGDLMGDGLHHEPDGKWITKEYKALSRKLVPGIREAETAKRSQRNVMINLNVIKFLKTWKCGCGWWGKQTRSGAKMIQCQGCKTRYKLK